jgi:hypothetical protein
MVENGLPNPHQRSVHMPMPNLVLPATGKESKMTNKDRASMERQFPLPHNVTQQSFTKYMSPYQKNISKKASSKDTHHHHML